jgi:uncharacterized membrane protein
MSAQRPWCRQCGQDDSLTAFAIGVWGTLVLIVAVGAPVFFLGAMLVAMARRD